MNSLERKKERGDRPDECSCNLCPEALNSLALRTISTVDQWAFSSLGVSIKGSIMVAPQNSSPTASVLFVRLRLGLSGNDFSSTRNTPVEPPGDTGAVGSFFA